MEMSLKPQQLCSPNQSKLPNDDLKKYHALDIYILCTLFPKTANIMCQGINFKSLKDEKQSPKKVGQCGADTLCWATTE